MFTCPKCQADRSRVLPVDPCPKCGAMLQAPKIKSDPSVDEMATVADMPAITSPEAGKTVATEESGKKEAEKESDSNSQAAKSAEPKSASVAGEKKTEDLAPGLGKKKVDASSSDKVEKDEAAGKGKKSQVQGNDGPAEDTKTDLGVAPAPEDPKLALGLAKTESVSAAAILAATGSDTSGEKGATKKDAAVPPSAASPSTPPPSLAPDAKAQEKAQEAKKATVTPSLPKGKLPPLPSVNPSSSQNKIFPKSTGERVAKLSAPPPIPGGKKDPSIAGAPPSMKKARLQEPPKDSPRSPFEVDSVFTKTVAEEQAAIVSPGDSHNESPDLLTKTSAGEMAPTAPPSQILPRPKSSVATPPPAQSSMVVDPSVVAMPSAYALPGQGAAPSPVPAAPSSPVAAAPSSPVAAAPSSPVLPSPAVVSPPPVASPISAQPPAPSAQPPAPSAPTPIAAQRSAPAQAIAPAPSAPMLSQAVSTPPPPMDIGPPPDANDASYPSAALDALDSENSKRPDTANAVWRQAHPSAQKWAAKRNVAPPRTPKTSMIALGLILVGFGAYLLFIFLPSKAPLTAAQIAERAQQAGIDENAWRFSQKLLTAANLNAGLFILLGAVVVLKGALYRAKPGAARRKKMEKSSVMLLACFGLLLFSFVALFLSASLR